MNSMRKLITKENLIYGLTIISILLIIWQISIFRKTFISLQIPLYIMISLGLGIFWLFQSKISHFLNTSYNIFWQAIQSVIIFGGTSMFLFMASNYYFASGTKKILNLDIVETGQLARGRGGCGNPYAIVTYNNTQKQLVFPCNAHLENLDKIKVVLKEGLFGYVVVKEMTPFISNMNSETNNNEAEILSEYLKLISKAEEYYSEGNFDKSIELYERAVQLNPNEKLPKLRLQEIRKRNTANKP